MLSQNVQNIERKAINIHQKKLHKYNVEQNALLHTPVSLFSQNW